MYVHDNLLNEQEQFTCNLQLLCYISMLQLS